MSGSSRARLALAILLSASLAGCVPWELSKILDGPQGKALAINPAETVLQAGNTITFAGSGGVPPYTYDLVSGGQSVDPVSGLFTAPVTAGTAVVRVTDKTGKTRDATITIQTNGSLAISPSAVSVVVGGTVTFAAIGGTPAYTFNMGAKGSGAAANVGLSSGLYTAGSAPGVDTVILTDSAASPPSTATITVTSVSSPVNYIITGTSLPASGTVSAAVPVGATFTLKNNGGGDGTRTVSWEAYLSLDGSLGGGDSLVGSGTTGPLVAGASAPVTVTGAFPAVAPGAWNLIVRVSAADDTTPSDNTSIASGITLAPRNIDYAVSGVSNGGGLVAGGPILGNFSFDNIGSSDGVSPVGFAVYVSTDTVWDVTDQLVASGTTGPAIATGSGGSSFSGTWPAGTGLRYLIVKISAADDVNATNDQGFSGVVTVTSISPVYTINPVPPPAGSIAGQAVSGTFTIQNGGTAAGSATVTWQVYASLGDSVYNAGDVLLDSGSIVGGLGISGSSSPGYSGSWPSTAGTWYIVVRASAADAPVIADAASPGVPVTNPPPPNYAVSFNAAIPWTGLVSTLMSATGTPQITISNLTGNAGHATINWAVYLSTDNVLDAGDTLLAQGTNLPLGGFGSATKGFDTNWPAAPGRYFWFIARASAADDSSPADDVVVSHPVATGDYRYQEGAEANNGNPPPSPPNPSSDTLVTTMIANKTIVIEGVMDAYNAYDTYKFTSTATMSVGMQARWATGFDDIDLYLWDSVGSALNSPETGPNAEPSYGTYDTTSVSARTWYVSAWFYLAGNTSGSTGQKYIILVKGMP
jgi:plastocyanin